MKQPYFDINYISEYEVAFSDADIRDEIEFKLKVLEKLKIDQKQAFKYLDKKKYRYSIDKTQKIIAYLTLALRYIELEAHSNQLYKDLQNDLPH
jgi:hypothetical protein